MRQIASLQSRLRQAQLLASRVALLSITVDPEHDSAEVLGRYARAVGADPRGWRFLLGTPENLKPILVAYDEWTRRLSSGEIDHPARLYLIDPQGQVREIYNLSLFDERQAFLDIQALLREAR